MIRRRRPQREIPFSFDSFLDVVANVVGIILRLILVAWVGARSYHPAPTRPRPAPVVAQEAAVDAPDAAPAPPDGLTDDLERQRRELAAAQQRLLDQVHQWEQARDQRADAEKELAAATARVQTLQAERAAAEREAADQGKDVQTAALSLPEIRSRVQLVHAEIDALQKTPPPPQHALRYKTPVSQPLQTEELFFECQGGRVTVIDVGAMLEQLHRERDAKAKQLATQWEVDGLTDPVGAFRMHYTLERERGPVDGAGRPAGRHAVQLQHQLDGRAGRRRARRGGGGGPRHRRPTSARSWTPSTRKSPPSPSGFTRTAIRFIAGCATTCTTAISWWPAGR